MTVEDKPYRKLTDREKQERVQEYRDQHGDLLTLSEACCRYGLRDNTIRKWITRKQLPCVTIDRRRYVWSEDVMDCIAAREQSNRGPRRVFVDRNTK
ncbi:helix-turn-helix domain-containing protein [Saxibacter everestensis]|uniref:Helix-turn-helix domain-containing protein n=1 Tax=Saxibacter everestensis TaxID=2909229 RepID=A0ABY8QWE7_9MICO|nr:helix-turn-helix domain-containing protein [Brevibacteriaceae bacterium ZFBP1038]